MLSHLSTFSSTNSHTSLCVINCAYNVEFNLFKFSSSIFIKNIYSIRKLSHFNIFQLDLNLLPIKQINRFSFWSFLLNFRLNEYSIICTLWIYHDVYFYYSHNMYVRLPFSISRPTILSKIKPKYCNI